MKYLLVLLFTVSAHAKFKVSWDNYSQVKNTEEEAKQYLEQVILKSKWMKCTWQLDQKKGYAQKVFYELSEVEATRQKLDENGNIIFDNKGNPVIETYMKQVNVPVMKYCKPKNFTVKIKDISAEIAAKEAKRQARENRKNAAKQVKNLDKAWKDLDDDQKDKLIKYLLDNLE